ncbi:alpha/beta hydrolase [Sediminibacterium ginsengisoli]|uniref:Acetyl esterase/lipase n=1 Tax=Sediminibacterium ginsengisoli TaxID=413434 RepID=A0A1T4K2Q3_9BACT|nr:alpha/beta hydrolase [Sediminibacterium ginsengisoli]SJZ36688.1 Acetyl esterase/lipase [Sediminibacterium ginsengisoli]
MKNYCVLFCLILAIQSGAQQFIPLWPEGAKPNDNGHLVKDSIAAERIWKVGTPGLYAFPVPEAENKGTTVMICPGGGYERLSHIYNGFQMARWFNSIGINAYVLIYRLPHQADLVKRETAAWQDAQRAMRLIRANATAWKIKADKIGVMGVSAGGHLASTLAIHTEDVSNIQDSLTNVSFRPDFMILLSPVITMGKFAHGGSKRNLLGADTLGANLQRFSSELNVTAQTPPTFIVHAYNDNSVPVQNSLLFYNALIEKKVNASLHVFPQGAHAIKLRDNPGSVEYWSQLCEAWMNEMNFTIPVNARK